jgi:hypothetical protein
MNHAERYVCCFLIIRTLVYQFVKRLSSLLSLSLSPVLAFFPYVHDTSSLQPVRRHFVHPPMVSSPNVLAIDELTNVRLLLRLEAVRHCRWVDEVVEDAPWVIDREFIEKHNIDYVAHDEDPYVSGGHEDVYAWVKNEGEWIGFLHHRMSVLTDLYLYPLLFHYFIVFGTISMHGFVKK